MFLNHLSGFVSNQSGNAAALKIPATATFTIMKSISHAKNLSIHLARIISLDGSGVPLAAGVSELITFTIKFTV